MKHHWRVSALVGVFLFAYLPILVVVAYSFNDSRFALTWNGFTLRWYRILLQSPEFLAALENTAIVALTSTLIATVLGSLLAVGLYLYRFTGSSIVRALLYVTVILPDIVMAVGLLMFYVAVQFALGRSSVILAHVTFQIPFVALVVSGRLQTFPRVLLEAAGDLGAGRIQRFRVIILPLILPGILAGAAIAFTLSIDDFLITYFTAGVRASTIPVRIYSMLKRGVTPDVNALATLMLATTFLVGWLGLKLSRVREEKLA